MTNKIIRNMYIIIYVIFMLLYFVSMLTMVFGEALYPDYETAYYWFTETFKTGNTILNIGLVTFLMYTMINAGKK